MAKVTGVVEVVMTNKFDSEKLAMKLEGDDTWYNQKKEWLDVEPKRGDTVNFDSGKTGKYIQYLVITEHGSAPAPAAKSGGGGFKSNTLGIELGHAANNAVAIAVSAGVTDLSEIKQLTKDFYDMMKSLRSEYEGEEKPKEVAKKVAKPAPKAEPAAPEFEDDIPF